MFDRVLNMLVSDFEYTRVLNMLWLQMVRNMPEYAWIIPEHAWTCQNISEYT